MWARAHQARARLEAARAAGSDGVAEQRLARAAAERARAAEASVEAAEHRADAREESEAAQSARDVASRRAEQAATEQAEQAELRRQEERIRARLQRHRDREHGMRRLRPGPGRTLGGSPAISAAAAAQAELLDHEITAIERLLAERGPAQAAEIARLVGARYWGPGVFRRALAEAVGDGVVRRVGRGTYAAAEAAGADPAADESAQ